VLIRELARLALLVCIDWSMPGMGIN